VFTGRPFISQSARASATAWPAIGLAVVFLALGALVYALDRPASVAWLWPFAWTAGASHGTAAHWFGSAGDWLPSLAHAYAFALLTACAVRSPSAALDETKDPRGRRLVAVSCVAWWAIDSAFEVGQHPHWSTTIADALPGWFRRVPVLDHVGVYFTHGTFDPRDLAATAAGCLGAWLSWHGLQQRAARIGRTQ
jgi:hypothetical protein